jgi:hypothetical protein
MSCPLTPHHVTPSHTQKHGIRWSSFEKVVDGEAVARFSDVPFEIPSVPTQLPSSASQKRWNVRQGGVNGEMTSVEDLHIIEAYRKYFELEGKKGSDGLCIEYGGVRVKEPPKPVRSLNVETWKQRDTGTTYSAVLFDVKKPIEFDILKTGYSIAVVLSGSKKMRYCTTVGGVSGCCAGTTRGPEGDIFVERVTFLFFLSIPNYDRSRRKLLGYALVSDTLIQEEVTSSHLL